MIVLRKYQEKAIEASRDAIRNGNKRLILQASCGAGKTILAGHIAKSAIEKGKKVLFFVHFRQLAYQAMERFCDFGIGDDVGIIMSGEDSHLSRPVQIASIQTYANRIKLDAGINTWFQDADVIFYDEAHASIAKTRKAILDMYKDRVVIGLTATPCRADERPLGKIYQEIVQCSSVKELTEMGFLVRARYFTSKEKPDLEGIKVSMGDYNQRELGQAVDTARLTGDILENYLRIAPGKSAVCFAVNVKHSKHIMEKFNNNGIPTEHIDAHTPHEDRVDILRRFKDGDTQVVTNVGVFSEGADFPWAEVCILARPTKSLARYIQMGSRVLRPFPGKKEAIIIDHARLIETHGLLNSDIEWTLDGKDKAWKKKNPTKKEPKLIECQMCGAVYKSSKRCPQCCFEMKTHGKAIQCTDEELCEVNGKKKGKYKKFTPERRIQWLGMMEWHRREKGYKPGWTKINYKEITGSWPQLGNIVPIEPDKEFKNWITHKNIKWAKRRATA